MKSRKEPQFEEQMRRLEEIVDILDRAEAPLAELLANYEEGMALAKFLREYLENAEQKVVDITKRNESSARVKISGGKVLPDTDETDNDNNAFYNL